MPATVIKAQCAPYLERGKPARLNDDDHAIVGIYGTRPRGIVNCYKLAHDVYRLDRLRVVQSSLLLSLANKHQARSQ